MRSSARWSCTNITWASMGRTPNPDRIKSQVNPAESAGGPLQETGKVPGLFFFRVEKSLTHIHTLTLSLRISGESRSVSKSESQRPCSEPVAVQDATFLLLWRGGHDSLRGIPQPREL